MSKFVVCFLFVCCLLVNVHAQRNDEGRAVISGKVVDSKTRNSIEYATITVYPVGSTKPVNGLITNAKGIFKIEAIKTGVYTITVDFIGYSSNKIDKVTVNADKLSVSLGVIALTYSSQTLENVTVSATKGLIDNRIDKMIYNVDKDLTSQGGMATDVLRKVPQVSVDIDGNIELLGSSSVRFLINGKPSTIFGNSISDALQSIPASQIQSIEVITSPGAKYSMQGSGGIINIVLKKSDVRGTNGSINLSAGTRLENGSVNFNYRRNNFGMNTYFSGNGQLRSKTLNESNRISTDTSKRTRTNFLQNGSSGFVRNGYQTGVGFDWSITKKSNLSGSLGYHKSINNDNGITYQETLLRDYSDAKLSETSAIRNAENRYNNNSIDWNIDFKKTFRKEGQELNISYNTSSGKNTSFYSQTQNYLANSEIFAGSKSNNPGKNRESEFSIDYTHPVSDKFKIETGVKNEEIRINSAADVYSYNKGINSYLIDPAQSYFITYKRDVYAYYLSTTFSVGKIFDVKAGGRYEYTVTTADYSTSHNVSVPSYSKFAPSFIVSHSFSKSQFLKLSYSYRIERPEYRELNPFVNLSDPHNISMGNPSLRPEIGNNFELGYNISFDKGSNINVAAVYRKNSDDITNFSTYYSVYKIGDSLFNDVTVSTRKNINAEERIGSNISGTLAVNNKLTFRSNAFLFNQRVTDNANGGIVRSSFGYRLNLNGTYLLKKDLAFEFFGNFRSKETNIQGTQTSFISYNMAMKKQFFNKKFSIGLTAANPFGKYVSQTRETFGSNFQQVSLRQIPFRSFGISLLYKFGKLAFKKSKEDDMNTPTAPF
ncbi:MAG: TonB-dependent receptor [Chitinophagaceae bacterium]